MTTNTATITVRKAAERGATDFGWLDSKHSFSFGGYQDPRFMGFGPLRVINDDRVAPGGGFAEHGHRDMEIVSYVLDGALAHKDSTGSAETVRHGVLQRMSAGRGVRHSEFNASQTEPVRFIQIWIEPDAKGHEPSYEEASFDTSATDTLHTIAAPWDAPVQGAARIHQDARIGAAILTASGSVRAELAAGRRAWVQVARGGVTVNGVALTEGDGAAVSGADALEIASSEGGEVLVFDLPGA